MPPQLVRDVVIDRAGVGLLFCDSELRQQLEDPVRLDLKLPCQLVDSDLTHKLKLECFYFSDCSSRYDPV
jgi:hypothetical protein